MERREEKGGGVREAGKEEGKEGDREQAGRQGGRGLSEREVRMRRFTVGAFMGGRWQSLIFGGPRAAGNCGVGRGINE